MVCSICGAPCDGRTTCAICGTPVPPSTGHSASHSTPPTYPQDSFAPTAPQPPAYGNTPPASNPYESYSASPGGWQTPPQSPYGAPPHQSHPPQPPYDSASYGQGASAGYGAPPPHGTQVCPKCANLASGPFCQTCGYAFAPPSSTWQQGAPPMPGAPHQKKDNTLRNVFIGIGVLYALLIAFTFIFYLLGFSFLVAQNSIQLRGEHGSITLDPWGGSWEEAPAEPEQPEQEEEWQTWANGVTQEEFDQIEIGMTYLEISAIIGGDGMIANTNDNGDFTVYWQGEDDPNVSLTIIFQKGKAVTFNQSGLKEE